MPGGFAEANSSTASSRFKSQHSTRKLVSTHLPSVTCRNGGKRTFPINAPNNEEPCDVEVSGTKHSDVHVLLHALFVLHNGLAELVDQLVFLRVALSVSLLYITQVFTLTRQFGVNRSLEHDWQ